MMVLFSILMIANVLCHLSIVVGVTRNSNGKLMFLIISDVIVTALQFMYGMNIAGIIWLILTFIDVKNYGYVFK